MTKFIITGLLLTLAVFLTRNSITPLAISVNILATFGLFIEFIILVREMYDARQ
jgi:hypothetical protein